MRRALLILVALLWASCSNGPAPPSSSPSAVGDPFLDKVDSAIKAGYAYLLERQQPDGAWRSSKYDTYKDGESLTPLPLKALLYGPSGPDGQAAAKRGLAFLAPRMPPAKLTMTFPNYSLSIAALCFARDPAYKANQDAIIKFLREQQLVETLGWPKDDLNYGGWGEARTPYRRPKSGKVDPARASNLSVTLFVLGALRVSGVPPDDPAIQKALVFVQRCQNYPGDGGFFFSPFNLRQNKAGKKTSYGSMTADGLRALLRAGLGKDDPRVVAARDWIVTHFDPKQNSGEFPKEQEEMRDALFYYYCWTTSHALVEAGSEDSSWARPMLEELLSRQNKQGFWVSQFDRMTEDEPLVATPMALAALTLARSALAK